MEERTQLQINLVKSNSSISSAAFLCYTLQAGGVLLSLQSVTLKHLVGNRWSVTLVKNVLPSPENSGLARLLFFLKWSLHSLMHIVFAG